MDGEESRLAQAMCHACLDVKYAYRKTCPIAHSGAVCIEVVEAAVKILKREEEREKRELAERIYSKLYTRKGSKLYIRKGVNKI